MKEIFVGNVSFEVSEADLKDFFENYGEIEQCKLITDRATGKSRGFGFVKYTTAEAAENAVKEAHGQQLKGRALNVKLSEPRERTGGSTGAGGFGGGRRDDTGRPPRRSFGDNDRGGRSDRGDRRG